ncbi:MAG TPA: hypothetical protein VID19_07250 [Candidatus Eremiobacteraceae bacterium]|jgi:putative Ca2+/H+ antiporter (TMEM165/GDT1 family)
MRETRDGETAFGVRTWLIFIGAFVLYFISSSGKQTAYDNYTILANAWLHGSIAIPDPGPAIDALKYLGKWYIIEAPIPAVIMLPLALLFGANANQTFACVLCGAVAVAAADVLLGRMDVTPATRNWTLAFLSFGTVLWWCTAFGAVWMFAHVAGAMFALLALAEWFGHRRPWLLGLLLACAALSRFPIILAALPFAWWLWVETPPERRLRALFAAVAGAAPLFVLYALYNEARWGVPSDIGYTMWYHQDSVGQPTGSPFRLQYLPFNLYSFFMLPPEFTTDFPWLKPSGLGVCLTLTSPALALALATARGRESLALWSAVIVVAVPSLLYYVNGFEQFGMRHSLDFTPFLIPLVARGMDRAPRGLSIALVLASIAANSYGMWYSWAYHTFHVVPL